MTATDAPLLSIAQTVARTSGAAAMRRAWPLALGLGVVGAVLFGPNGLSARDLTLPARHSPLLRAVLWSAWMLASLPFARALLGDRSLRLVLSQPVSRTRLAAVLSAWLLIGHSPWIAFRARGEGVRDALASALVGVVGSWTLAAPPRRRALRLASTLLAIALVVTPEPWALATVATLVGAALIPAAMSSLGAPPARSRSAKSLPKKPFSALVAVHARLLARASASTLSRQVALVCAGAALIVPTLRNNAHEPTEARIRLALACVTLPLATFGAALSDAFDRSDRGLRARLTAEAVAPSTRAGVALAVTALPTAAIAGLVVALATACGGVRDALVLGAAASLWGAGLAASSRVASRRVEGADVLKGAGRTALVVAGAFGLLLGAGTLSLVAPIVALMITAREELKEAARCS